MQVVTPIVKEGFVFGGLKTLVFRALAYILVLQSGSRMIRMREMLDFIIEICKVS